MTAVCGVWEGCRTAPWWPRCSVSPGLLSSAAVDTRPSPRPRGSSRRTSPVTFRTTSLWPTCEWSHHPVSPVGTHTFTDVLLLFQHPVFPVRHLRPGLFFLPLLHRAAGRGLLHHQCCQADLWGVQEHHVWPLPQLLGEPRSGMSRGEGRGGMERDYCTYPFLVPLSQKLERCYK